MGPAGTPESCSLVSLALEALAMAQLILLPSTGTLSLAFCVTVSTLLTVRCLMLTLFSVLALFCPLAITKVVPPPPTHTQVPSEKALYNQLCVLQRGCCPGCHRESVALSLSPAA